MKMTVEEARAAHAKADAELTQAIKQDCESRDGSGAQEARREARREKLQEMVDRYKQAVKEAMCEELD